MNEFSDVLPVLEKRGETLGRQTISTGVRLIGKVPERGPKAWLHEIFPGLKGPDLQRLESDLGRPLPPEFATFLQTTNGLHTFHGSLSIEGLRWSYVRQGDETWQPFSLITPNVEERVRDAKGSFLFVGFYKYDGSRLYIDSDDGRTYFCGRYSAEPRKVWPSFHEALLSEVLRLDALFGPDGLPLDPDRPTVP